MLFAASNPRLSSQLVAAIPLALLACLSPTAIALMIFYLGRDSAKRLMLAYYSGAFVMTYAVGVAGVFVLHGIKLDPSHHQGPSAAVDMALGVLLLGSALVLARHKRHPAKQEKPPKQHNARVGSAVLLGLAMWIPSLTYLSALKLVSDSAPTGLEAGLTVLLLTLCVLLFIEGAFVLYLVIPDGISNKLQAFDAWFGRHIRAVLIWLLSIAGFFMLGYGIYRLVSH